MKVVARLMCRVGLHRWRMVDFGFAPVRECVGCGKRVSDD